MANIFDRITILALSCLVLYISYRVLTRQTCIHDLYITIYGAIAIVVLLITTIVLETRERKA